MFAGIIINNESKQLDRIFTYKIPDDIVKNITLGSLVKIPFGKGNKILDGFVIEIYEAVEIDYEIKSIIGISNLDFKLRKEDVFLVNQMKERYLCSYLDCIKTMLPTGLLKGGKEKTLEKIYAIKKPDNKYEKENYINIFNIIKDNNGKYTTAQLNKVFGLSISSINTLIKYGYLSKESQTVKRYNTRLYANYEEKTLNEEQKNAVDIILNSEKDKFLLHGITGSGKTEVYLNLVNEMLKQNKGSIILVPEISLTPQMIERFKGRFGEKIAVFHSRLSEGERFDEWLRVKNGEVFVAVGARSAIFLPMNNLGLIVIDEEHELSYKSDNNPKYNAKEIAEFKQNNQKLLLVLGSATPSVETYYKALSEKYMLIQLKNRIEGAYLPEISIVDMRDELIQGNKSMFSSELYAELEKSLNKKEQVILFLNRRGHSSFVSCRKCGYVFKCDKCDITLTYHKIDNSMQCHYCGKNQQVAKVCPKCGSKYVKYFGIGTEKIQQEVNSVFPTARVLRMDFDTTRNKNSYESIYNDFKENKADILIGTQMIAKGLDFDNVTLVGVIAADTSLNFPDFRSSERTFQLLTQVSGRAGRGKKKGKVVIQTYNPTHYSITYAANNDYLGFYNEDISIRENLNYPPFAEIFLANFSSVNESILIKNMHILGNIIKEKLKDTDITMLGPCACSISKIKDNYRWQIILKGKISINFANEVKIIIYNYFKNVYNDIRVSIDVNPSSLL